MSYERAASGQSIVGICLKWFTSDTLYLVVSNYQKINGRTERNVLWTIRVTIEDRRRGYFFVFCRILSLRSGLIFADGKNKRTINII